VNGKGKNFSQDSRMTYETHWWGRKKKNPLKKGKNGANETSQSTTTKEGKLWVKREESPRKKLKATSSLVHEDG